MITVRNNTFYIYAFGSGQQTHLGAPKIKNRGCKASKIYNNQIDLHVKKENINQTTQITL